MVVRTTSVSKTISILYWRVPLEPKLSCTDWIFFMLLITRAFEHFDFRSSLYDSRTNFAALAISKLETLVLALMIPCIPDSGDDSRSEAAAVFSFRVDGVVVAGEFTPPI